MTTTNDKITELRCINCGKSYEPYSLDYTCPSCGPRRGTLEVIYDYDRISEVFLDSLEESEYDDLRKYEPLLPVEDLDLLPPLRIGGTPLYPFHNSSDRISELWIKDDGGNPTASYKDRATAFAVAEAGRQGLKTMTCASTGNAASSLAGLAASAGMDTVIFVPRAAPEAKIAQLLVYGANVFAVDGSYDQAYDLATEVGEKYGWYNRSAAMNPYLVEGKKTGAIEMADQLNWEVPDTVFVSVGDGSIVSGVCKGFKELEKIGVTDSSPRVIGVQAQGADTIASAFDNYDGEEVRIEDQIADTLADSISVGKPRDIVKAVKYVYQNGGDYMRVSDREISDAQVELARRRGIFSEPAAATAYAGFKRALQAGHLGENERIGIFITGNGLKDVDSVKRSVPDPEVVSPKLSQVEEIVETKGLS